MHNYEIFNLNDLKKVFKHIQSTYNNHTFNVDEDDFINVTLNIQSIYPVRPFYFYTLNDNITHNITEEDYNGMLYTIKILLSKIYNLLDKNLIITLNFDANHKLVSKNKRLIKEISSKFIRTIIELQRELDVESNKLFLQIKNPHNITLLKEIIFSFQNTHAERLKISGGLIFQDACISSIINIVEENYLEELIKTNVLMKIHSIEINFINLNNYDYLFNSNLEHDKFKIILEKEKIQLLKLFNIIKNIINKYNNITRLDISFCQSNLNNPVQSKKTFNLLPKEHQNLQHIYNSSIQDSILTNIRNKLEKYLYKFYNLDNSIQNLTTICNQQIIIKDNVLINKLQKNMDELLTTKKNTIQKFINYTNVLNQTDDSSVFYYLAKFHEYNKDFNTAYEYLELVNQDSMLYNEANNLKISIFFKLHANYLENSIFKTTEATETTENKSLIFSQFNYSNSESSTEKTPTNKKIITYQPLLAL